MEKRKALGLSLEDVEKETKIRKKYLEAIEKNNFFQIAESAIVKGFIRNYSQTLGLSPENVLAVFRRDFKENEKGQIIPRGMVDPLNERKFYWTPKETSLAIFVFILGGFIFFFVRQYLRFNAAPPLEIFSPSDGQKFQEKVLVKGKTDKDASVKIDGTVISISEDGSFQEEVILPRGDNILTVEAINRQGKRTIINKKIKVE